MDVVIAVFDDWNGIYIDGKLEYENHSLDHRNVLDALNIKYESIDVPMDELDIGRLPDNLEELKYLVGDDE